MTAEPKRTLEECHAIMTAPGQPFELTEVTVDGLTLRAYKALPPSLKALWMGAQAYGERDYIVYEDERYTFVSANQKIVQLANLFWTGYGSRKGDTIAICARNFPEWIFCFWAVQMFGGVAVAINAWLPGDGLVYCITLSEAKVVLLDAERAKALTPHIKDLRKGGAQHILVMRVDSVPNGMKSLSKELETYQTAADLPEVDIGPEDNATILFTSGTTGRPKGVLGSQRQLLTNIINSMIPGARAALRKGEDMPQPDPTVAQKALLLGVPLFHATGLHSSLAVCTALGMKVVMLHKWSTERAAELVLKEGVTSAGGMPFMAMELVNSLLVKGGHVLESIGFGGGPASGGLSGSIPKALGKSVLPGQGYGATEVSSACANVAGDDFIARPRSTGLPCLINDIKCVDDAGKTVAPKQLGEVYVRGINRTKGYWKNEKATKEAFLSDGFYRTGDIGYLDEENFLYIVDRAKDIIIRGGENIASVSVEDALYRDERLLDVAVVPVPDVKLGELVAAAVVTKPEFHGKVTESELTQLVAKYMPKHCVPVIIDVRTQTLPRNGTGKTMKSELKKELAHLWEQRSGQKKAKL